jgi:hypothetical protein
LAAALLEVVLLRKRWIIDEKGLKLSFFAPFFALSFQAIII